MQGQACRFCGECEACAACPELAAATAAAASSSDRSSTSSTSIDDRADCSECESVSKEDAATLALNGKGVVCDPECLTDATPNCNIFGLVSFVGSFVGTLFSRVRRRRAFDAHLLS